LQSPMRFKPPNCKRLQGAADARHRVRRRTVVLQVPDNKAGAGPFDRSPFVSPYRAISVIETMVRRPGLTPESLRVQLLAKRCRKYNCGFRELDRGFFS
jgi:hypothetical protein